MNYQWRIDDCLDEVTALMKMLDESKISNVKEREYYFLVLMKELGKKPIGATELTREEMLKEITSKGKKALSIEVDDKGEIIYKFVSPKEKD